MLNRPVARPASCSSTLVVAISVIGTNVLPMPNDISNRPGSRSVTVAAVDRDAREVEEPERGDHHADDRVGAHADPLDQDLRGARAGADADGHRQEREAGLDRLEAQDLLDVEGREEEQREQAARDQQQHDVGDREAADLEDAQADQRALDAGLDEDEDREQRDADRGQPERSAEPQPKLSALTIA